MPGKPKAALIPVVDLLGPYYQLAKKKYIYLQNTSLFGKVLLQGLVGIPQISFLPMS